MSMGSLQGIVEDSASAPGMASGEPSQCADGLVRSLQLQGLQDTLRYEQLELENAEKLGARALGQLKRSAQTALLKASALSKPPTEQAASGAEPQAPGPACEPGAGLEGEPQAGAAKQSSGGLHAEPAGSAGEAPLLPEAPCSGEGYAKSEKCADKPPQASGQGAATSTDAAMVSGAPMDSGVPSAAASAALPQGCLAQVDCDAAWALDTTPGKRTAAKFGSLWGTVAVEKDGMTWLWPLADTAKHRKQVPSAWLIRLSKAPRTPCVWKKNANLLRREQRAEIAKEWLPVDPPRNLPGEKTLLSEAEMALGIVEIGWRLMLPRCLVVPPHICGLVAHHVQSHAAAVEKHKEGEALVAQLTGYAERAMLLCMPIICGGHWTLLVVQRAGAVLELDEEPVDEEPVGPDAPPASKGCLKCS